MVSVLRFASDLANRAMIAARAGITFGGKRDLYEALGFLRTIPLTEYRARFCRNGIAARVVEAKPQATWRGGAELIEDEDADETTDFEQAWLDLDERLQAWATFKRADVLAGLGRYAVILIGAPGKASDPLTKLSKAEDVLYLAPYAEDDAKIATWEEDTENPRFGLPLTYKLTRRTDGGKSITIDAHWTRVLHIADGCLDDKVYGQPRLERVWNDLDNLEKVVGAGSEAYWQRVHQGMHVDIDKDATVDAGQLADMKEQVTDFEHGLRRVLTTRAAKVQMFGSDVSSFGAQVQSIMSLISGATSIPQRILLGSERGELASTQDAENWDEQINDRRDQYAEPSVVRPFVDLLVRMGALPKPADGYDVRWPEVDELTEADRVDLAVKASEINTKMGDVVILPSEIRDRYLRLDALESVMSEAELEAMREEMKPEPVPPMLLPGEPAVEDEEVIA